MRLVPWRGVAAAAMTRQQIPPVPPSLAPGQQRSQREGIYTILNINSTSKLSKAIRAIGDTFLSLSIMQMLLGFRSGHLGKLDSLRSPLLIHPSSFWTEGDLPNRDASFPV